MRTFLVVAAYAGLLTAADSYQLFRQPALSKTQLVFHYAGDLWSVPREGGEARRLTSSQGEEIDPYFSPDGKLIAFTGQYDGNTDVFVVPATGGQPKRITYHPGADLARGWTPDGKRVMFRSTRNMPSRGSRLYTVPIDGATDGSAEELPFPLAEAGSLAPDAARIAYEPVPPAFNWWKRYRGGRMSKIWIGTLADSSIEQLPRTKSNDFNAMWVRDKVYFLSDREGPFTLFSYDTRSKKVQKLVENSGFDLKSAAASEDAIVYEQFGGLYLYDIKSGKSKQIPITLSGDLLEVRPRLQKLTRMESGNVSPTGVRAVFGARGEIFTVPAGKGDPRNLTRTPGVAERDPSWSPDGRWISYFSDESGEYELVLRDQMGQGGTRSFRLGETTGFYSNAVWSPDSNLIAFTDNALHVAFLDVASGKVTQVDTDRYSGPRRVDVASWSPDSKWLVYTKQEKSSLRRVYVYSLDSGKSAGLTDGLSDAFSPAFDREGKYLYFLASTNVGLQVGWRDMSSFDRPVTASAYLVVLRKDVPSPLAPESDEEKIVEEKKPDTAKPEPKKEAKLEVKIDFDGMGQRILALPIPARDYSSLMPAKTGVLFLLQDPPGGEPGGARLAGTLHKFDLKTRRTELFLAGVTGAAVTANGDKLLTGLTGNRWSIVSANAPPKPGDGVLKLDSLETWVDPRAEWMQMFREAWRIQRDFFYEPNLHGVDVNAMSKRYEPFVARVGSRGDLNYLLGEMMGEFTAGHLYVTGGQKPEIKTVPGGLLGCDFKVENGRYRFAKVYGGENWNPDARAPLTQPGVNVAAGEYLIAVNGRDLPATANVYQMLEATANKQVTLRVGADPTGAGAREVVVVPTASDSRLRYLDWIEDNRRKVDQLSGGKLAYVHLPDTQRGGYTSFNRYYFAQVGKEGAIMDERFNAGGAQPDYIIDYLRRPLMHYRNTRHGEDFQGPLGAIFGPKVMMINEFAGSGGDSMPWYFRKAGIGQLVGKTTWGGLVGGGGGFPNLMDGGSVTAPSVGWWDPYTGEWVAENVGIHPDVEVDLEPKSWRQGHDTQLEKAVEVLMVELKKPKPAMKPRPPFPNYHKSADPKQPGR
ncbi:MAG: PDZ domain-containing protein [Acidobacteriota bacterium]